MVKKNYVECVIGFVAKFAVCCATTIVFGMIFIACA